MTIGVESQVAADSQAVNGYQKFKWHGMCWLTSRISSSLNGVAQATEVGAPDFGPKWRSS
jgi:hypothetical protein